MQRGMSKKLGKKHGDQKTRESGNSSRGKMLLNTNSSWNTYYTVWNMNGRLAKEGFVEKKRRT